MTSAFYDSPSFFSQAFLVFYPRKVRSHDRATFDVNKAIFAEEAKKLFSAAAPLFIVLESFWSSSLSPESALVSSQDSFVRADPNLPCWRARALRLNEEASWKEEDDQVVGTRTVAVAP